MNSARRQIVFVWNYLEWGGAQIYFLAIIKQAKPDWDVVVLLPADSSPEIINLLRQAAVTYEFLRHAIDPSPALTIGDKLLRQWKRIRSEGEILHYLRKFDLAEGILHIETAPWQSWLLLSALSRRGANIFVTMHNFLPKAARWRELIWKARMQFVSRLRGMHIIASNHDTKNRMKEWVAWSFWQTVPVAHTAVDPDQIEAARMSPENSASLRRRHDVPCDKTVVLAVGQFIDRKGRWVFLDAAAKVLKIDHDVFFIWLTPKLPNLDDQKRIESYGLGASFKMVLSETLGKDRSDVLKFFNVADIFALPSYVEGLPIALLEAMALGIASISTNVYAIPEAVMHMETGMLISPGNSDELANAILTLKSDKNLRRRLSNAGRAFVPANFDQRVAARKCLAAYSECFDDGR